jgi:hypothetical protein
MSVSENATTRAHANATVRLCSAREELWRAESDRTGAQGTPAAAAAVHRVGEAAAKLATREQWLHWVEHGTTIRPAEDGEWGLVPGTEDVVKKRAAQQRATRVRDRLGRVARPGLLRVEP